VQRDGEAQGNRPLYATLVLILIASLGVTVCAGRITIYLTTHHTGALNMQNWRNTADRLGESSPDIQVETSLSRR
jgi:hypothetical protein